MSFVNTSVYGIHYLFIRIPKTASTSICKAFERPIEHKTALEWRSILDDFDDRFKFTVVRDPYERFLSMYYFFAVFPFRLSPDVNHFLEYVNWDDFDQERDAVLTRPQSDFLFDEYDNLLVDYVGRYESLDKTWEVLQDRVGIRTELPHRRKCRFEKYKLNDVSKDILYNRYKRDFELLGYKK